MTLKELKNKVESGIAVNEFIIFVSQNTFIPHQYINELSNKLNVPIIYSDSFESMVSGATSLFASPSDDLRVYITDEFSTELVSTPSNSFVICSKISKNTLDKYKDNVINVPALKEWQMLEYAELRAKGVQSSDLSWLVKSCNNIFKLDSELDKLSIFTEEERPNAFSSFVRDGVFSDICDSTMFDVSNAIIQNDKEKLCSLLERVDLFDFNVFALLALLSVNLNNIFSVQTFPGTTAKSLGISDKQLYVIKKYQTQHYSAKALLHMLEVCLSVENKIKMGELPADNALDYLITKLFLY